jgi:hypothetical protein
VGCAVTCAEKMRQRSAGAKTNASLGGSTAEDGDEDEGQRKEGKRVCRARCRDAMLR